MPFVLGLAMSYPSTVSDGTSSCVSIRMASRVIASPPACDTGVDRCATAEQETATPITNIARFSTITICLPSRNFAFNFAPFASKLLHLPSPRHQQESHPHQHHRKPNHHHRRQQTPRLR